MGQRCVALLLLLASALASAQQTTAPPAAPSALDIPQLLHDVEQHQKDAEAAQRDYTYHVHIEQQELDNHGNVKKTTTTDAESITIDGIRVDRIVARDGKPLTPKEAQKESDRIDKEVAKAEERREHRVREGKDGDPDDLLTVSRILELGTFSNPRRIDLNGRPTIVLDYTGNPNARTHNRFEEVFRDLVGTAWIDQQDRVLVRAQGHFLHDFKVGAGLLLDIHQGLSFDYRVTHVAGNIWLPATVDGSGTARILLFDHLNGNFHLVTSNYRRFHTSSTIIDSNRLIGPDGQPVPQPQPNPQPQP